MDRVTARKIGNEVAEAITAIAAKYGAAYVSRSGRYDSTSLSLKLELADVHNGEVQSAAVTDFKRLAERYGLEADDLGRQFKNHQGVVYTITGLNTRAKKYPIKAERHFDGRNFKFTAHQVRDLLGR